MNTSFAARLTLVVAAVGALLPPGTSRACPFCSAVSMTLGEELKTSDAAVIATLIDRPASSDPTSGAPVKSKFKVVKALKGEKLVADKPVIEMLYFGSQEPGTKFLLFGVDPKDLAWGTPTALNERSEAYLEKVAQLPDAVPERLAFFQEFFEDEDPLLSGDAFNEFGRAQYNDVVAIKDRMHRDKLIGWIKDEKVPASRRRLYLTMLGTCGTPEDVPMIEAMITTDDRQVRTALDAMIGCYLSLKGAEGLPLVEDLFLKNDKAEYIDTYSAIVALRVLGQETNLIPKERLVEALRHMLDRPQLADLVISDLARWQDWGAADRLVDLFKNANEESSWVRVPVVQFLRASPDPKAKEYLKELAEIDPDAVKRATNYLALPGAGSGPPTPSTTVQPAASTETAQADIPTVPPEVPAEDSAAAANDSADATSAAMTASGQDTANKVAAVSSPAAPPADAGPASADAAKSASADTAKSKSSSAPPGPLSVTTDWTMVAGVFLVIAAGSALLFRRK